MIYSIAVNLLSDAILGSSYRNKPRIQWLPFVITKSNSQMKMGIFFFQIYVQDHQPLLYRNQLKQNDSTSPSYQIPQAFAPEMPKYEDKIHKYNSYSSK